MRDYTQHLLFDFKLIRVNEDNTVDAIINGDTYYGLHVSGIDLGVEATLKQEKFHISVSYTVEEKPNE